MAFYLLPVPWLIAKLREVGKYFLEKTGIVFPEREFSSIMELDNLWENYLFLEGNRKLVWISGYNNFFPILLIGAIVYVVVAGTWLVRYWRECNSYKKIAVFMDSTKFIKDVRYREKVHIATSSYISSPVVVGMIKPLILLPASGEQYEKGMEGVVLHELRHIKGKDIMVKIFLFVIQMTEWFNPFVYYMAKEELTVSEMICDEAAIKGMTKANKVDYMKCVLEAAQRMKIPKMTGMYLGTSSGQLTERMERMMGNSKKKTWKKKFAVIIVTVCSLTSMIPAYAYQGPVKIIVDERTSDAENRWMESNAGVFMPDRNIQETYIDVGEADCLFINEDGFA